MLSLQLSPGQSLAEVLREKDGGRRDQARWRRKISATVWIVSAWPAGLSLR